MLKLISETNQEVFVSESDYNNFLKEESQYDGEIKTIHRTEKGKPLGDLEQFKNTERITYGTVSLTIPDEARIKWYLQGEGNIYYAPKLIIDNNDIGE